jgi:hypothetical protein
VPAAPSEFGSPEDAERWTRDNLGIRTVDYGEATAVGVSIVTHGLAIAWPSGMDLPRVVVFSAEASWGEAEVARMNPAYGGRLELNPTSPYWAGTMAEVRAMAREAKDRGFRATADPRHPILHELGHLAHWEAKRASWDDDWGDRVGAARDQQAMAGRVSGRAAQSPAQFVAEVFAGLRLGEKYPVNILTLYALYGGLQP